MGIAALNKAESRKATQLALRHMSRVEGVTQVSLAEGYVEVETSNISGVALVPASINQTFIDNCIDKNSPKFKEGEQLYDDYHKFYLPVDKDEEDSIPTDRSWMIKIVKHKASSQASMTPVAGFSLVTSNTVLGSKKTSQV